MKASYKTKLLLFFSLFIPLLHAEECEYVYPIATIGNEKIIYIHQTNLRSIQLLAFNSSDDTIDTILWSLYTPTQIKILTNNKGFSFLDNGRLRIQLFDKRSPRAIDFDKPIYNLFIENWIDEHRTYCSAQYNNHSALFELNDDGTVYLLCTHSHKDYLYPQKIDDYLFFIERCVDNAIANYRIVQANYSDLLLNQDATLFECIADFADKPIIFLTMISKKEGFVIEHQKTVESNDPQAMFWCYYFFNNKNKWVISRAFSFAVPTKLFFPDSKDRLFESIIPLMPKFIDNKIYFADASGNENNFLEPYWYDIKNKEIRKNIGLNNDQHYFVPMLFNNQLWYGGNGSQLFVF